MNANNAETVTFYWIFIYIWQNRRCETKSCEHLDICEKSHCEHFSCWLCQCVCVCICHRHEFSALFFRACPIEKERESMRLRTIRTNKLKSVYTFIISDRVQCTIAYNIWNVKFIDTKWSVALTLRSTHSRCEQAQA